MKLRAADISLPHPDALILLLAVLYQYLDPDLYRDTTLMLRHLLLPPHRQTDRQTG